MSTVDSVGLEHRQRGEILAATVGRRCRVQGIYGPLFSYGIVTWFENDVLTVRIPQPKGHKVREFVYLEVHAEQIVMCLVAYLSKIEGDEYRLIPSSELETRPVRSQPRRKVDEIDGKLLVNGETIPILIRDVSENGFGYRSETFISDGVEALVDLSVLNSSLKLNVVSRHCRYDFDLACFIGGFEADFQDGWVKERWKQFVKARFGVINNPS